MNPPALILHATGTNRDHEAAQAVELAGGQPEIVHLNQLRSGERRWSDYQILVLPGGFSYADALGAGRLLALDLNAYFSDEVRAFVETGKPAIGICNGFQALVKAGILSLPLSPSIPPSPAAPLPKGEGDIHPSPFGRKAGDEGATLTFNARGHFECRWITLKPVSQQCIWTRGLSELIYCPVAHGEGNFQLADESQLADLAALEQIALVYTLPDGSPAGGAYPHNPNGSIADIAGICNPQGNVLGLMPHPEDHLFAWQHPHMSRGARGQTGLALFENGVKFAQEL
jgi:phosphoribosylformylglycinamidine synthase I